MFILHHQLSSIKANKTYLRDGRAPIPVNESTSRVMSANKGKNTKPEISLRKALWHHDLKGYRVNYKKLPGSPDIVFTKHQLAIFVNGCYWHRCPLCDLPLPKSNQEFWKEKFKKNKKRDFKKISELEEIGYKVLVIWECRVKSELHQVVQEIKTVLK